MLYCEDGKALAQAAQRSCGCLIPGSVQGQLDGTLSTLVWWKGSLPMAGRFELDPSIRSLSTQTILWFCNLAFLPAGRRRYFCFTGF